MSETAFRDPMIDTVLLKTCESICDKVNFMSAYIKDRDKAMRLFLDERIFGKNGAELHMVLTEYMRIVELESIEEKYSKKIEDILQKEEQLLDILKRILENQFGIVDSNLQAAYISYYILKIKYLNCKLLIALAVFGHFYTNERIYVQACCKIQP
jgi:hypothetical protein